jgi:peptidyl-prolyl cis-trans isomerase SurA
VGRGWYPGNVRAPAFLLIAVGSCFALGAVRAEAAPSRGPAGGEGRIELDRVVAVVNDEIVLRSELDRTASRHPLMVEAINQLSPTASPQVVEERTREVEAKVLDELIDLELLRDEARRFEIKITDADVDRAMEDMVARQFGMSVPELRKQVEASGEYESWDEYREELRDQLLQFRVPQYLATWSVSEAQIREHYRKLTRDESERVEVAQFSFKPQSQDSAGRDRAFALAQAVGRRLRGGESADAIAGEIEYATELERSISRGDVAPALEEAVFSAKKNAVVGPLGSGQGYVVFKVLEHVESGALSFEEAKERIREQLENEAFYKAQEDLKRQLRAKAHIDIRL